MSQIESGAMLISGKRCGQIRLTIGDRNENDWHAIPTGIGSTFADIIWDTERKLTDLETSRSPNEHEIEFVKQWLVFAYQREAELEAQLKEEKIEHDEAVKLSNVVPIDTSID